MRRGRVDLRWSYVRSGTSALPVVYPRLRSPAGSGTHDEPPRNDWGRTRELYTSTPRTQPSEEVPVGTYPPHTRHRVPGPHNRVVKVLTLDVTRNRPWGVYTGTSHDRRSGPNPTCGGSTTRRRGRRRSWSITTSGVEGGDTETPEGGCRGRVRPRHVSTRCSLRT